jgi:riboflavin synthase
VFTGIIEQIGQVKLASPKKLVISASLAGGMKPGDSLGVNGVCLTITQISNDEVTLDIMPETLKRSNLGSLKIGGGVNLERPVTPAGMLGGHLVQGHIDATGKIISMQEQDGATLVTISAPESVMRYIVEKGFIAVDGISLTVSERQKDVFSVSIVPFTMKNTNLHNRKIGDTVNLEADIIAKYVESTLSRKEHGITMDFLKEQGFLG